MSGKTLQIKGEVTNDTITLPLLRAFEWDCDSETGGLWQLLASLSCCTKFGFIYFQELLVG